jgi:CRISPR-associated protein Cmr6
LDVLTDLKGGKAHLALAIARYFDEAQHSRYQGLLDACQARQRAILDALQVCYQAQVANPIPIASVVWRMVVGIGRPHVWENALALHPLYGFPYIPGSSVKGLVRLAAFWEIADTLDLKPGERPEGADETWLHRLDRLLAQETDESAWKKASFPYWKDGVCCTVRDAQALFGTVGRKARGIFLDALPEAFPRIEADIMNPHFQKYYQQGPQGTQPPSDDLEPNPIFFLTVGNGTCFHFPLAVLPGQPDAETLLNKAKQWLKRAITEFGVGAKTRAGYGELTEPGSSS